MRIVVVGATGNVGSRVVRALSADDRVEDIVGIARRRPDLDITKVRWVEADIAADPLDEHLGGAHAVVHLAWLIQPMRDPRELWRVNIRGTGRLLDAAARARVQAVVYASSVAAYSPGPRDREIDETWPTHGIAGLEYAREKAYVERMLDAFEARNSAIRLVRLRPGFIFQRAAASEMRRLFLGTLFPNRLLQPRYLPAFPQIADVRFQCVHTDDVAEAYRLAIFEPVHGALNVASDPVLTTRDVARVLDARPLPVPGRAVRSMVNAAWRLRLLPIEPGWVDLALEGAVMDTSRVRRELGWQPRVSAHDALAEVLAGIHDGAGDATPTLVPDRDASRIPEVATRQGAVQSLDPRTG